MNDTVQYVLVIESHEEVAALAAYFLRRANYHPVIAQDGAEGLRLARELSPALILCDAGLRILNGFGVLGVLRSDPITAQIPVVTMSSYAGAHFSDPMPNAFLEKPFQKDKLIEVVRLFARPSQAMLVAA